MCPRRGVHHRGARLRRWTSGHGLRPERSRRCGGVRRRRRTDLAVGTSTSKPRASPSTMVVGVHRHADEEHRLHEYSPGFDPQRFAAHEAFFVDDVRDWVESRFGVGLPAERTAIFGASAGAELALALGLGHPDIYGAILGASPVPASDRPRRCPQPSHVPTSWPARVSRSSSRTPRDGRRRYVTPAPTSS